MNGLQDKLPLFGPEVSISGTPQDEEQTSHMTDTFATEIILSINLNKYRCKILLQSYYYIIMFVLIKSGPMEKLMPLIF